MKPLVLKMKAFGSYAEETLIDFNSLGTGLYLVTGDTGAGKTTIFDAIVFALYGEVSGNHRSVAMMHTDFLPLSED
ncbi:MAG: AAA family ATPase, partial [Oscillospiraceae bacterium]